MSWTYIDDVLVDVVEEESPTFSNTISEKPVETGSIISDHIENAPLTLTLSCIITGREGESAADKYERLQEIATEKELVEITGVLQNYSNMAIENLPVVKDTSNKQGFQVEITFKQVRVVEFDTVEVEIGEDPETGEQVQSGADETEKKETEEDEVDEETEKSIITKMIESTFNTRR